MTTALLQMDAFPAGMELFPAADDDAWTLIKRVIDSSDYYLLVIGGKYGSIDPETEVSFTEKEYDYAVDQGKPVMAFLHSDPDKIEFGKSEKDNAAREKLKAFREKVEKNKHVKYWSGPENLAGMVALSYASFRQTYPATGWIRGDVSTSAEVLEELNELRKQLAVAKADTKNAREGPPDEAKELAQGDVVADLAFQTEARVTTDAGTTYNLTRHHDLNPTWDNLFSAVGPEMLSEASDRALRIRIRGWLDEEYGRQVKSEIRKETVGEGEIVTRILNSKIDITGDDFGTLIIQLRALGLIEKSERQRSVEDTETYWTLTAYGDQHLTTLRAIRREEAPAEEASA